MTRGEKRTATGKKYEASKREARPVVGETDRVETASGDTDKNGMQAMRIPGPVRATEKVRDKPIMRKAKKQPKTRTWASILAGYSQMRLDSLAAKVAHERSLRSGSRAWVDDGLMEEADDVNPAERVESPNQGSSGTTAAHADAHAALGAQVPHVQGLMAAGAGAVHAVQPVGEPPVIGLHDDPAPMLPAVGSGVCAQQVPPALMNASVVGSAGGGAAGAHQPPTTVAPVATAAVVQGAGAPVPQTVVAPPAVPPAAAVVPAALMLSPPLQTGLVAASSASRHVQHAAHAAVQRCGAARQRLLVARRSQEAAAAAVAAAAAELAQAQHEAVLALAEANKEGPLCALVVADVTRGMGLDDQQVMAMSLEPPMLDDPYYCSLMRPNRQAGRTPSQQDEGEAGFSRQAVGLDVVDREGDALARITNHEIKQQAKQSVHSYVLLFRRVLSQAGGVERFERMEAALCQSFIMGLREQYRKPCMRIPGTNERWSDLTALIKFAVAGEAKAKQLGLSSVPKPNPGGDLAGFTTGGGSTAGRTWRKGTGANHCTSGVRRMQARTGGQGGQGGGYSGGDRGGGQQHWHGGGSRGPANPGGFGGRGFVRV